MKVCSIGSGAGITEYKRWIKPLWKLRNSTLQSERSHPGGWGEHVGFLISRALADHPKRGISRHIHILTVRRGSILVETNYENIYPPEGPRIEIRMPQVAQGYDQFCRMAESIGHEAAGATC